MALTDADYARLEAEEPQVTRCAICGSMVTENDYAVGDVAEMYAVAQEDSPSKLVHYECGKARGWEIA